MKKIFILFLFIPSLLFAQKIDKKLQTRVEDLVRDFKGDIGVYVKSLKTGKTVLINADTLFPTASIVKIPILLGIMDKVNKGELAYQQDLVYEDSLLYAGEDILGSFKSGQKISLAKVILLMLSTSDNTASLWLQKIAGTGSSINELLHKNGFEQTRVNSRTIGRETNRNMYGWGQTTPKEMGTIVQNLYDGKWINDSLSKRMIRLLGRNYWDEQAISEIPATVFVASKNGAVDASRSEVLLVMAKEPYIFAVFTKNNEDKSWTNQNEAWALAKQLSKMLFQYFNK